MVNCFTTYLGTNPYFVVLKTTVTDCGSPQEFPGADVQYTTTTYRSVATYKCRTGYESGSQTPSLTQECQGNGTWTGMTPVCNRKCSNR